MLYAFSLMVYAQATGTSHDLVHASLGVVDEDRSALSQRIVDGFLPPRFQKTVALAPTEVDRSMDRARFTFALDTQPDLTADVLAGKWKNGVVGERGSVRGSLGGSGRIIQ